MNISEIITITIVLAALFGYLNHRLIKWPPTIGIMVLSLSTSILLAVLGKFAPFVPDKARQLVLSIDFKNVLFDFMLSY